MPFAATYSSWINQVERLFAAVARVLLQRSDHRSVQALEKDLREWVKAWNQNPNPFICSGTLSVGICPKGAGPRALMHLAGRYHGLIKQVLRQIGPRR